MFFSFVPNILLLVTQDLTLDYSLDGFLICSSNVILVCKSMIIVLVIIKFFKESLAVFFRFAIHITWQTRRSTLKATDHFDHYFLFVK